MKICKTINNIKVFAKQRNYTVRYKTVEVVPNFNGYTNVLTQDMINEENVKYVLKYDFDLENATITVPLNCCLEFDGGSIKHGTIIGQDTFVNNVGGVDTIFGAGITQEGTWRYSSSSSDPKEGISRETADELYQPKGSYQPAGDYPTTTEVEQMISDIPKDVDDHLDATSVNPVQNKVVTETISNIQNSVDIDTIIYHSEYGETAFNYREQFQSDAEGAPEYTPTSVQGVAITSDNIFLFCLTHNDDVENHKPVVYCFDRYYNMQGYCTLNTNSHLNDATVYNGSIYIPDYHHHKIHHISASALHTACVNHTAIALLEISVTDIMGQLDYDEESNTFCATFGDASNYHVCIMDTNFNIIKECSTNIINVIADHFNRDVVYQGCVYSKGKVLFDIGLDGQKGFTMAVYDVETDAFEKYISIPFTCDFLEGEGMCKDPNTGDIMVCCNNWSYACGLAFEIGRLLVNKNEVTFNKPFTDGVGYVDMSDTVYVYVNNNPTNKNYVPTGSAQYPYRSIMEALTCAKRFGRWLHIALEDTGIPYYMVGVSTTQMTTLRFSSVGNPTVIAHIVLLNQTHVQFDGINIIASRYTMNRNSIFCVNGFNISVRISRCTITMTENNYRGFGYSTDYYTGANIIVRGCTFNGCNNDSPVYPNFVCKSVAIVANPIVHVYFAGNEVNTFNHCIAIDVISNHVPKVEATSVATYIAMVFNDAAFIRGQWCPFDGDVFLGNVNAGTGERFESLKDFLKYCTDKSCSVIVDGNLVTPAGSMIRGGRYVGVNISTDEPQVYKQTFISYNYPLLIDAYNYGVYGTTSQRPPSTVVSGGCPYYDTNLFRNIYWNWNRQQWLDADGHPAIRRYGTTNQRPVQKVTVEGVTTGDLDSVNDIGFEYFDTTLGKSVYWTGDTSIGDNGWVNSIGEFESNGENLIKESSNLQIREPDSADVWESWRKAWKVLNTTTFPYPSIVNADFNYIEGVAKAFEFPSNLNEASVIVYNIKLNPIAYSFGFWVKGAGHIAISINGYENVVGSYTIDNLDYEYHNLTFRVPASWTTGEIQTLYIIISEGANGLTICAPKLEIGAIATMWKPDSQSGLNTQRPAHPNIGEVFFDKSIGTNGAPIWYAGNNVWVDSSGNAVQ